MSDNRINQAGFILIALSTSISLLLVTWTLSAKWRLSVDTLRQQQLLESRELLRDTNAAALGLNKGIINPWGTPPPVGSARRPWAASGENGIPNPNQTLGKVPYQQLKVPPKDSRGLFLFYDANKTSYPASLQ